MLFVKDTMFLHGRTPELVGSTAVKRRQRQGHVSQTQKLKRLRANSQSKFNAYYFISKLEIMTVSIDLQLKGPNSNFDL